MVSTMVLRNTGDMLVNSMVTLGSDSGAKLLDFAARSPVIIKQRMGDCFLIGDQRGQRWRWDNILSDVRTGRHPEYLYRHLNDAYHMLIAHTLL